MPEVRHLVTLLFLDIPTALHVRDQQGTDVLARFLAEAMAVLDRIRREHGGEEVRTVGSTLLIRFADPLRGLQAACRMHAVADACRMVGVQPRLRIGVHRGEVTVHGRSVYGEAVSTAARLVSLCAPGQTLTSETVRDCLPEGLRACLQAVPEPVAWSASLGGLYEVSSAAGLEAHRAGGGSPDRTQQVPIQPSGSRDTSAGNRRIQLTRRHRKQAPDPATGLPGSGSRLCLVRGTDIHIVDERRPLLALGREIGNDIVVDSTTASRRHAQVEWRPDGFYLVDHSWNGTYLYDEGGRETHVHDAECRLQDSGYLCPGCPVSHEDAEALRFVEAR